MRTLNKGEWAALVIGAIVVIGVIFYMGMSWPHQNESATATSTIEATAQPLQTQSSTSTMTDSKGVATVGSTVTVNYTGKLADGTVFDSTDKHGQPFSFVLGVGQVIKGWDTGVVGMKVGESKHLVIAPEDGYGADGIKDPSTGKYVIPPNATLTFDVTLLNVQ